VSAGNGKSDGRVAYEAPSPAMGARMLAVCHTELPEVYAWLLGYAATGMPPSKPRHRHRAPDLVDGPGDAEQRSMVGGR
jgi:hypothetical protein